MGLSVTKGATRQFRENDLNSFLECGAFAEWDDKHWLLFWGDCQEVADQPPRGVFISDFFREKQAWLSFEHVALTSKKQWCQIASVRESKESSRKWVKPASDEFRGFFDSFKHWRQQGEVDKAVPVVFSTSSHALSISEKKQALSKLSQNSNDIIPYGFWNQEQGLLGGTPEVLFSGRDGSFSTMALAGTARLAENHNLLNDDKELHEHKLVIEDISERLRNKKLVWSETREWEVGNLKHLRTDARFEWQGNFVELVSLLHPTPALGLYPRSSNWQKLKRLCNPELRGFFGAPFGIVFDQNWLCLVAIRNVQWNSDRTILGSGCGLVEESTLEKEWHELKAKREFTLGFLDI